MSELKEIELGEAYKVFDDDKEFYLKSEADKVIAELKKKLVEQATLRAWAEIQLRHSNYKRCVAMAEMCNANYFRQYMFKPNFWKRLEKRWLELSEKYKEAK